MPSETQLTDVPLFYEVLDEHLVAADAEADRGFAPQYGRDEQTPLDKLARAIAGESHVFRELGGPPLPASPLGTVGPTRLTARTPTISAEGT